MDLIMFTFKIDSQVKKELAKEARQKGISLSSYIRMILSERKK